MTGPGALPPERCPLGAGSPAGTSTPGRPTPSRDLIHRRVQPSGSRGPSGHSASAETVGSHPSRLAHLLRLRGGQPHSSATQGTGQGSARGGHVWLSPADASDMLSWAREARTSESRAEVLLQMHPVGQSSAECTQESPFKKPGETETPGTSQGRPLLCLSAWSPRGKEGRAVTRFGSNVQRALTPLIPGPHSHAPPEAPPLSQVKQQGPQQEGVCPRSQSWSGPMG